jgi:hypothetical protein
MGKSISLSEEIATAERSFGVLLQMPTLNINSLLYIQGFAPHR